MEEHIAAIRNLQRNFDFHSKILEKLMISLTNWHLETQQVNDADEILYSDKKEWEGFRYALVAVLKPQHRSTYSFNNLVTQ